MSRGLGTWQRSAARIKGAADEGVDDDPDHARVIGPGDTAPSVTDPYSTIGHANASEERLSEPGKRWMAAAELDARGLRTTTEIAEAMGLDDKAIGAVASTGHYVGFASAMATACPSVSFTGQTEPLATSCEAPSTTMARLALARLTARAGPQIAGTSRRKAEKRSNDWCRSASRHLVFLILVIVSVPLVPAPH